MSARFAVSERIRALVVIVALAVIPGVHAQQPAEPAVIAAIESLRHSLDQVEATINRDGLNGDALADLRLRLAAIRDQLRARGSEIGPQLYETNARLQEIGQPPAKDAPPEAQTITADREQLQKLRAQLDAAQKQANLLRLRADNLSERVTERRRAALTRELLARSPSALDPTFWLEGASAVPARSMASVTSSAPG